jgi:hypothetical protein
MELLRLRGPLASDPTARILHGLLIGLLGWITLYAVVFVPRLVPRPAASAGLTAFAATFARSRPTTELAGALAERAEQFAFTAILDAREDRTALSIGGGA